MKIDTKIIKATIEKEILRLQRLISLLDQLETISGNSEEKPAKPKRKGGPAAYWAKLTPVQRSREMRRRIALSKERGNR